MYKQLTAACALLMVVSAFGSPVDVSSTNVASASISDKNPQSGQMVKKFSSNREEDAQNIRHYIDGILGQMSRNTFDQTISSKQGADQGVEEEEGNPEEAQLWGRYGGYGRRRGRYWGRGRYGRYGGYGGRWGYGRYGGYGGYGGCDWGC
ncbi:hypothetical protein K493DRAFT_364256 [Basidiobolus meristosporus CBS 931.73]|uniref:Uncharacterized protein n=1 Tax=Basidiobolus meristosporus CBS 931.73 TaxID=1314790 RepID=A0A1Y1WIS6_9FUNG|nr:hypothetical protein K493DRAFT_364256 [Basidiobolus meristosporus CBS 931.73]|eukprot:ORX73481.1 hypothetical protein K493DRAFT_364256 [Basidiobolus meristosporus CBS 931.73]